MPDQQNECTYYCLKPLHFGANGIWKGVLHNPDLKYVTLVLGWAVAGRW